MKFLNIILTTMVLVACGQQNEPSSLQESGAHVSYASQHVNNTETNFSLATTHQDLSISQAFVHVPANNLYGNRYLIADFKVRNLSYDKRIEIAVNGQWRTASFADLPASGGVSGSAFVRWLGSDDGYDRFSILLHEIMYTNLPTVELKVAQHSSVQYTTFKIKKIDRVYANARPFTTAVPAAEIKVTAVAFAAQSRFMKISLDLADLDQRKLIQIECTGCTGSDQFKKTLQFISRAEAEEKSGIVFETKAGGREQVNLYLNLAATRLEDVKALRITYLAPGYLGTPTLGAQDGVYGKPFVTVINL